MKRILFPVDFSPQCDALAPAAASLARRFDAQLALLHVIPEGTGATLAEELRGKLESYQRELLSQADRVIKIGAAAEEIVEQARHTLTELILMPTHGRTRFRELLLGSVTAAVLHDSYSAVLTSAHAAALSTWTQPHRIVCAIDTSPFSAEVLDMADHFAIHHQASLHVFHAIPQLTAGDLREADARDRYPALAAPAEVKQPLEIITGETVNEAILQALVRAQADLLVVGRGQLQGVLGRLRSGVHELIRRAPCPVLSV